MYTLKINPARTLSGMAVIALSVIIFYRLVNDFYYPNLHFMHKEFEDTTAPWNNTVPGYFGFGYVRLESEVRWCCY